MIKHIETTMVMYYDFGAYIAARYHNWVYLTALNVSIIEEERLQALGRTPRPLLLDLSIKKVKSTDEAKKILWKSTNGISRVAILLGSRMEAVIKDCIAHLGMPPIPMKITSDWCEAVDFLVSPEDINHGL